MRREHTLPVFDSRRGFVGGLMAEVDFLTTAEAAWIYGRSTNEAGGGAGRAVCLAHPARRTAQSVGVPATSAETVRELKLGGHQSNEEPF